MWFFVGLAFALIAWRMGWTLSWDVPVVDKLFKGFAILIGAMFAAGLIMTVVNKSPQIAATVVPAGENAASGIGLKLESSGSGLALPRDLPAKGRAGAFSNKQLTKNEFAALVAGRWGSTVPLQATGEERPDGSRVMFECEKEYVFTLSPTKEIHGTYETAETYSRDGNKTNTQGSGRWVVVDNPKRNRDGSFTAGAEFLPHDGQNSVPQRGDSARLDRARAEMSMEARARALTVSPGKLIIENFKGVSVQKLPEAILEWRGAVKDSPSQASKFSVLKTNDTADIATHVSNGQPSLASHKLTSLSPDVAATLVAEHNRKTFSILNLDGVTSITPEVAGIIANHKGQTLLNGLTAITPEVATALARKKGRMGDSTFLSLGGLTEITPTVDAILRASPAVFFPQR
jgi:hypothetical protein